MSRANTPYVNPCFPTRHEYGKGDRTQSVTKSTCGYGIPNPHMYPFLLLDGFFQCTHETYRRCYRQDPFKEVEAVDRDVLADRFSIVRQGYPGSSRPR
jgi:hypothetical protein